MKKAGSLIVLLGWAFFSTSLGAATYDATGRWDYSVFDHCKNCNEPPEPGDSGSTVLIQTANTFLLVFTSATDSAFKTVSGTIKGAAYAYTDRYWADGGWVDESVTFTLSSS